jgi:hypothetical protein
MLKKHRSFLWYNHFLEIPMTEIPLTYAEITGCQDADCTLLTKDFSSGIHYCPIFRSADVLKTAWTHYLFPLRKVSLPDAILNPLILKTAISQYHNRIPPNCPRRLIT